MKNSLRTRILSIVLTFALLLTAITPLAMNHKPAHAADSLTNQSEGYTGFYYFSDYEGSEAFYKSYVTPLLDAYDKGNNCKLYREFNYWNNEDFWTLFYQWYDGISYVTCEDAFVIFEIRHGIKYMEDTKPLYDIFSTMKGNGCKIMFICDTDEARFSNPDYNKHDQYHGNVFLDYVDIHINTDRLLIFIDTILNKIEEETSYLNNVTLILNNGFADSKFLQAWPSSYGDSKYGSILKTFIIPYFYYLYDAAGRTEKSLFDFLNENNTKVICQVEGNIYLNLNTRTQIEFNSTDLYSFYEGIANDHIFAIGIENDYSATKNWISNIVSLYEYSDNFPIYLYGKNADTIISDYAANFYIAEPYVGYGFPHILDTFISDGSLIQYDNWDGRCDVTHKTITIGGGWLNVSVRDLRVWQIPDRMSDSSVPLYTE